MQYTDLSGQFDVFSSTHRLDVYIDVTSVKRYTIFIKFLISSSIQSSPCIGRNYSDFCHYELVLPSVKLRMNGVIQSGVFVSGFFGSICVWNSSMSFCASIMIPKMGDWGSPRPSQRGPWSQKYFYNDKKMPFTFPLLLSHEGIV